MGWNGVNNGGHDCAEDDVSVEVAALGYRSRDNGGTCGGKGALAACTGREERRFMGVIQHDRASKRANTHLKEDTGEF